MPGVWTWNFGEGFGHHFLDSIAMNHNSIGRGYETYGNAGGETVERIIEPSELTKEWYRPSSPDERVRWSMRNNVNYQQTGCLAILDYAADLSLDFESLPSIPDATRHSLPVPRIGVWVPWADTDSIGWIRYALDQEKIPYLDVSVGKGRVLAYNFNPMHRDLNRSDFRLLWNGILNWRFILDQ